MKKQIDCPVCNGRGYVTWNNCTESTGSSMNKVCPHCDGTGKRMVTEEHFANVGKMFRLIDARVMEHELKALIATAINRGVSNIPMGKDSSSAFDYLRGYERGATEAAHIALGCPKVDAVEVDVISKWLYEIAINNTGDPLCAACIEIIRRLDGLVVFARERKDNADN